MGTQMCVYVRSQVRNVNREDARNITELGREKRKKAFSVGQQNFVAGINYAGRQRIECTERR